MLYRDWGRGEISRNFNSDYQNTLRKLQNNNLCDLFSILETVCFFAGLLNCISCSLENGVGVKSVENLVFALKLVCKKFLVFFSARKGQKDAMT